MADDDCTSPPSSTLLYLSPHSRNDLTLTSTPNASDLQPDQLDVWVPAEPDNFRSSPVQQQPLTRIPLTLPSHYSQIHDSPPTYTPIMLPLYSSQSLDSPPMYSSQCEFPRPQHRVIPLSQQALLDSFLALEAVEYSGRHVSESPPSYHDSVLPDVTSPRHDVVSVATSPRHDVVPVRTSPRHDVVPVTTSRHDVVPVTTSPRRRRVRRAGSSGASYSGHIIVACFIIICCCMPCGCIAWVLAVVASDRALEGRDSVAQKLGGASLCCSVFGIGTAVLLVILMAIIG